MVFISVAARLLINVEALNMVESIGNVTRHRRVTLIVRTPEGKLVKVEVPAISGETLAHAYQANLVRVAKLVYNSDKPLYAGGKLPVCEYCLREEFIKSADQAHTIPPLKNIPDATKFEENIIKYCLVEDIGGFLRAERPPSRRTSRFFVGYMVPTFDSLRFSSLESQFHARHIPSEALKQQQRAAQMIYYIEVGSALYNFLFHLDVDGIGTTSLESIRRVIDQDEFERRVKVALGALQLLLVGEQFGAKRTRFLPIIEIESLLCSISDPLPFTLVPAISSDFMNLTIKKKNAYIESLRKVGINEDIILLGFSKEFSVPDGIQAFDNPYDLLKKVTEIVLEKIKKR